MASGQKRMIINTRERAISPDINRLQDFVAAARAEILRAMYNDRLGSFYLRPGINYQRTASPTDEPLPAEVYGGLEVIVDDPTDLEVEPGVMMAYTGPAASSDDSPYVLAIDPDGFTTPGTLTFQANAGPNQRIDVIECRPSEVLLEDDSRDEYDTATGLFTPQTVDKVRTSEIEYRIRRGTPGNGPPGYDPGWLPLCVAVVQQGAADWTEVDFYDVRPLISERAPVPSFERPGQEFNNDVWTSLDECSIVFRNETSPTREAIRGYFRGQLAGYYCGGDIRRNTPSSLADFGSATEPDGGECDAVWLREAGNKSSGFSYPSSGQYVVAALFLSLSATNLAHVLPRWIRYSQTAAPNPPARRRPTGARGILVATANTNLKATGLVRGVNPPAIMGWGFAGYGRAVTVANTPSLGIPGNVWASGDWHDIGTRTQHPFDAISGSGNSFEFDLVAGTDYPVNAERLQITVRVNTTDTTGTVAIGTINIDVDNQTDNSTLANRADLRIQSVARAPGTHGFGFSCQIPLPPPERAGDESTPATVQVRVDVSGLGTLDSASLDIVAWKLR